MSQRTFAIIQARMSSTRLPGKVLLPIAGQPMLARVVERTRRAACLDGVIVATTTDPSDDPIAQLCAERGYACSRGSLQDVLDRYYQAACAFQVDVVARITADCPVMDPQVVDLTVRALGEPVPVDYHSESKGGKVVGREIADSDFATSRLPPPGGRSLPIGLDVEVVRFDTLQTAWREANQPFQREHVMPFFYEGITAGELAPKPGLQPGTYCVTHTVSPRGFVVAQLHHFPDYGAQRWTVDTAADLELLRQIYARFDGRDDFSWPDVQSLFEREPELAAINANVRHKTAFDVG